ncbi:DUF3846 domain-containing protein [Deinococcus humi]|uniref:DUF3846 domain-containing protein n=1 Tax=Deinococcus humi TaxID=662880 RepID=A0A7W8K1R4_9DEIO|nr:DUF3846 domain-containing protein [Deinococcus humi]MBB5365679.1 hypothetical protein [Deinococcus humi]GGO37090.1 hypothetical protein GCM10008949_41850 [Deinococcus humi]
MTPTLRVIYPDGRQDVTEIGPETDTLSLLRAAVGGWIEYLPAHYHALNSHEVVINEEGLIHNLPPNWIGSRLIGLDLTQYPPLHGPIVIVPHDPADGPSPAKQRQQATSPDSLVHLYARALEGDPAALTALGVNRPEDIAVIDARPQMRHFLYALYPDGRTERRDLEPLEEGRRWIAERLGVGQRLPPHTQQVSAYAVISSVAPRDPRPNSVAHAALGLSVTPCGPVVLIPTGTADPSPIHQRLDEALNGGKEACEALGLLLDWVT